LSDSSTYLNKTFADLFLTPGKYVWKWGTGLGNQNFTLEIGVGALAGPVPTPVPEPSTFALLGFGFVGLLLAGKRRGVVAGLQALERAVFRSNRYAEDGWHPAPLAGAGRVGGHADRGDWRARQCLDDSPR